MENIFYGKNRRIFLTVYLIILFLWLAFIFGNSLADSTQSEQQSNRVVEFMQNVVQSIDPDANVQPETVRTTAHFVEFVVLGLLYSVGTFFIRYSRKSLFAHSLSLSLFTAFIDETLQLTSSGRSAQIKDVWVDFAGAFIAHVLVFAVFYTYRHFKNASK